MASERLDAVRTENSRELATVIGQYALGELTLGQAANQLDVSRLELQTLFHEIGVELRLGPQTEEEAQREIDIASQIE